MISTSSDEARKSPLGSWQAKNWNPAVGSTRWEEFCEALDKPIFGRNGLAAVTGDEEVLYDDESGLVTFVGWDGLQLDISVLNYAKYIKEVRLTGCVSYFL